MNKRNFSLKSFVSVLFVALLFVVFLTPVIGIEFSGCLAGLTIVSYFVPMPQNVLGLNNTNNQSAREAYDRSRKMFFKAMRNDSAFGPGTAGDDLCWKWVNNLKLSQSEIILECEFNATATNFRFGLTQNQPNTTGVVFNTENRLTMQDSLCCNEYAVYVGQPTSRTDTLWRPRTYGNTIDFAAAFANEIDTTFFSHGYFKVTCNNDIIMPFRQLYNHYYRGQTQQTAALGAGSPGDENRGAQDGMITAEPNFVLIGSKGYIPEIILPTSLPDAAAFSRMRLVFRGILAQNSTVVS